MQYMWPVMQYMWPVMQYMWPVMQYMWPVMQYMWPVMQYMWPVCVSVQGLVSEEAADAAANMARQRFTDSTKME